MTKIMLFLSVLIPQFAFGLDRLAPFASMACVEQPAANCYPGIVVGVIEADQVSFRVFGLSGREGLLLNEHSIFEIASVSKALTGLAIGILHSQGKIDITKVVPDNSPMILPRKHQENLRWIDLVQHRSGFPRTPSSMSQAPNPMQPYETFGVEALNAYFATSTEIKPAPADHAYSNTGAGVAGYLAASVHQSSFDQMLQDLYLNRLGMHDTRLSKSVTETQRIVQGHINGEKVEIWKFSPDDTFVGGAGLLSTASDLAKLLQSIILQSDEQINDSLRVHRENLFNIQPGFDVGLFWMDLSKAGVTWHNGGSFGMQSFVGFNQSKKRAVVVLANAMLIGADGEIDSRIDVESIKFLMQ
jgi:D-alanyl-D-alanine-carboxypeptidase/D-alanyl-D-alanine-endopeptidase